MNKSRKGRAISATLREGASCSWQASLEVNGQSCLFERGVRNQDPSHLGDQVVRVKSSSTAMTLSDRKITRELLLEKV